MKKITGILVVFFLMICSLAAAAGPEFRSNVSASKWLQVKDSVIDVTDKDGLILKVQWPVFSSKDDSKKRVTSFVPFSIRTCGNRKSSPPKGTGTSATAAGSFS